MRNSLFEPYKRNHAANSKPLGTWTRRKSEPQPTNDEDEDDE